MVFGSVSPRIESCSESAREFSLGRLVMEVDTEGGTEKTFKDEDDADVRCELALEEGRSERDEE